MGEGREGGKTSENLFLESGLLQGHHNRGKHNNQNVTFILFFLHWFNPPVGLSIKDRNTTIKCSFYHGPVIQ